MTFLGSFPRPLDTQEVELYLEQGFVVRERVFPPARLERLRAAVEDVHARIVAASVRGAGCVERIDGRRYERVLGSSIKWEWDEGSREIRSMEPVHHLHPELDALVDEPQLTAPCAQLLGRTSLSLFTDKLNFKRAGGSPFPWHQDAPYWAFGCAHLDALVSLQLYLDDARVSNGCLWAIPGSHRHGMLPAQTDRGVLGRLYTDVERLESARPVPIEAPAGSVIFFDGYLVHGSKRNRSDASRRALILTYQPAGHPRWNHTEERAVTLAENFTRELDPTTR